MLVSPQRVLASLPHFVRGRSSFSIVMRRKLSDQPRWDREQLARYGIGVEDAQRVVENAIGGDNVSTVVNGQEGYRVSVAASGEAAFGEIAERDTTGLGDHCPMGRLAVVATVGGVSPLSRMVLAVKK